MCVLLGLLSGSGQAAGVVWTGGSLVDNNWSDSANWLGNVAPSLSGEEIVFAGTTRLTPNMDKNYSVTELVFSNTAGGFSVSSSTAGTLTVGSGGIVNDSASAQTLSVPIVLSAAQTFDTEGNITFSNAITGGETLLKAGAGTLTLAGLTNVFGDFQVTNGFLEIDGGVLVNDTSGAFSRISGCNVDIASNAVLTIANAGGGWFPIGDTPGVSNSMTVNGGTFNVIDAYGLQIARNGNAALTINSGSVLVNDANALGMSMSEGQSSPAGYSTVNLNGGRLAVVRLRPFGGVETFNFNGGTLSATANNTGFFPADGALTANVRNGGAIVDTAGFNVTIGQQLVHSTLAGDNAIDGGLVKTNSGVLTLSGGITYTGPTTVLGGTLSMTTASGVPAIGGDLAVSNATFTLDASSGVAMPAGNVTLNSGVTLSLTNSLSADAIKGTGNLLVATNVILNLNYPSGNASAAAINVAGSITVSGANNVINIAGGSFAAGQFPLIKYGSGSLASISGFQLGPLPQGVQAVLTNNTANQSVDLNITLVSHTATVDSTKTYQTIEGLGGATAFYAGWITAHPYKQEIYSNAFAGLNLSMLRLGDWYRYQTPLAGFDSAATEIVSNANRVLGHPVPVYMSSWSPPAFLKSNGQVGNGGTLIYTNGSFAYTNFAQYWYDSIQAYQSNGVNLAWASIQNEPDFVAGYDSCIFHPTEDTVNGTNYASYSKALDAVYQRLTNLPSPPKLLAPECVHIAFNDLNSYAATMNPNSFYGVAHHLYGDGGSTGDSFLGSLSSATNVFPGKPHFMTEYGDVFDMIECANLIHNCLVVEQVSGYNHWNLVWPGTNGGLIQIENPYASQSTWTNAPPGTPTQSHGWWYSPSYWSMKHFSYFIQPGYKRVSATDSDSNVRSSAFLSPDGLRLVVVLINTNSAVSSAMNFNFGIFSVGKASVYQTADTNYYFQPLGSLTNGQALPPRSLTTVVLDKLLNVGSARNPLPSDGASGVALNSPISWTPGSNALTHAVYLGVNSNAVAQATTASPQFLGIMTTNTFYPALAGGTAYFWRVDEIAGVNTNIGAVWSFTTAPTPLLMHRYSFSETNGTTVADSVGGPAWTGTLPNGGTLSGGQLLLSSNSQQYVSLPAGIVGTLSNFTIETWVKLTTTANWNRILDFGNNTTTYMFLTPQNGSTSRLRFAITTGGPGGEQQINGASALAAGVWNHVVVTLNGNTGVLYLNGGAVGTNSAMNLTPLSLGGTSNNYLGKSQWNDPYLNGAMDEFRIYSAALSSSEIAATYALGPGQLLSSNSPQMGVALVGTNLAVSWPLANAGFTVQSRTDLALGEWVNVTSPAPQIVGSNWQATVPLSGNAGSVFYRLSK